MIQDSTKLQLSRTNCFNFIRLLAALQVMFGHALAHLEIQIPDVLSLVLGMFPGVPIFFALSGFLIWFSVARSENVQNYMEKRFWRIYPELWLGVAVEVIVLLILYRIPDIIEFVLFIIGQATILQFWTPNSLRGYGCGTPNGSLWTICVLIQFYVIVWWLYKVLHGKSLRRWIVTWCTLMVASNLGGMLLARFAPEMIGKLYDQTVLRYLWLFMIGCFFAEYYGVILPYLKKYWALFLVGAVFFHITGFDIYVKYHVLHSLLLFASILGFAYSFPQLEIKRDISYGIYIYHMTVVNAMLAVGMRGKPVYLVIVLAGTLILAYLSSIFMERIVKRPPSPGHTYQLRGGSSTGRL